MTFSTIILAGGLSSRMGQDKALLEADSGTLLDHMRALAQAAGSENILVSRDAPGCIPDNFNAAGPLAGLEACLPHCRNSKVLVLAVDTPLLGISSICQLVAAANRHSAYASGSPLPCVLHVSKPLLAYVRTLLMDSKQKGSMRQLLEYAEARPAALQQQELFNANTPSDWQLCRHQLQTRRHHG